MLVATVCLTLSHDDELISRLVKSLPGLRGLAPLRPYDLFGFLALFVLPMGYLLVTRQKLTTVGLSFGRLRFALPGFLALFGFLSLLSLGISRMGSFQGFYHRGLVDWSDWGLLFCSHLLFMWGWEFMNRGFLLGLLRPRLGVLAVYVQLLPFVLLHLGKPTFELYGSVLFGLAFGYYAYVARSFIYCAFLHAWFAWFTEVLIATGSAA